MKKTKRLLFAIVGIAITILSQKTFSQTTLDFDDKYFNAQNGNPIYTSNIAEITFNTPGDVYDGFGLFFLGTGTDVYATLTINNQSITCSKQLNGYFTTNFTDYAMFPLDQNTQNKIHDTGIDYKAGGLFYECVKNGTNITGVYGQVIREYLSGTNKNEYKLQAGITKINNTTRRADISSLQVIYSDNFRNDGRTMSGTIVTSTSTGSVTPRFFGDVGITNAIKSGTKANPLYIMTGSNYNETGFYKIFARSSVPSTLTKMTWTGFDIEGLRYTGTIATNTGLNSVFLPFYGYKDFYFPQIPYLVSGTIATTISGSWSKTISFFISGVTFSGMFSYTGNSDICTTGVTITILPTHNTENRQYKRGDNDTRTTGNNIHTFTGNRSGQVRVKTNGSIISGDNLFINITNIDKTPPTIRWPNLNTGINQCGDRSSTFEIIDDDCGSGLLTMTINGVLYTGASPLTGTVTLDYTGLKNNDFKIIYTGQDSVGNTTQGMIELSVLPSDISARSFRRELKNENGDYIYTGDRKTLTKLNGGGCDNIIAQAGTCTNGGQITIDGGGGRGNNILKFTVTNLRSFNNNHYKSDCTIIISGEYKKITVTGTFIDCTKNDKACKPTLNPIFTGGVEKYSYYDDKSDKFQKYTSGNTVNIQINGDCVTDNGCKNYSYSLIQGDFYCTELTGAKLESTNHQSMVQGFWNYLTNKSLNGQICSHTRQSRNFEEEYKDTFTINNFEGHHHYDTIPYNGKNQGTRQVWIEISDEKGRTGRAYTDIINYTTQNPTIEKGRSSTNLDGSTNMSDPSNPQSFSVTITAIGATLPNGQSGHNSKHENNLSGLAIFKEGLFNFDQFNEWIITPFN